MNFLRKIYNLITHKYDQLNEIRKYEEMLQDQYNGDLDLAFSQIENGNFTIISKE